MLRSRAAAMLDVMDKPKRPVGRPKAEKPRDVSFSTRGTADHWRAMQALLARTRRTSSIEVLLALEFWLEHNGLWPPKKVKG
jgi:hypothetical protein